MVDFARIIELKELIKNHKGFCLYAKNEWIKELKNLRKEIKNGTVICFSRRHAIYECK